MFKTDCVGRPLLHFDEALSELISWYLHKGCDGETICCDLYFFADKVAHDTIPDRLLPDDWRKGRTESGDMM